MSMMTRLWVSMALVVFAAACGEPTYLCESPYGTASDPPVWCRADEACFWEGQSRDGFVVSVYECMPMTESCPDFETIRELCPIEKTVFCLDDVVFEGDDGQAIRAPLINCQ